MKLYLFILVLIYIAMAQEQWETVYTSFQSDNPYDAQGWIVSNNYQGNLFTKCNGVTLFGGYYAFGKDAIVSKLFKLPPHYQLKITFQFWKINSWDNESVYLIAEDYKWSQDNMYYKVAYECELQIIEMVSQSITFVINHNSESLIFIMTTNLDEQANNESWGIRDFSIQILRCPQGCSYCQDNDYNNCYYWIGYLSLWHESIEVDGWIKNNNMQPTIDKCGSFDIIKLAPNDKLEKIIENLNAHYKMQVQLQIWKIDSWHNEMFILEIDDQIYNQTILESTGIYNICGSNGLENIINIAITLPHSLSKCKITMRTNHYSITTNAYWGIRAFNIYLAKCFKGCDQCLGPLKTECTVCSSGWVFYNNLCTHSPPMLFSQIQITQIKDLKQDERISMEINLLEVDQKIISQGNITLLVNNNQQILTIHVYAKCIQNKIIKSQFLSNKLQDLYQYQFQQNCQGNFNSIIYNVKYQLRIISEQQLIINTSDTYCLIYQIVEVDDEKFSVKILEILLVDF